MSTQKKTDLLDDQIQSKLKKAKHDYKEKKEPLDAGKVLTVIVVGLIVLGLALSIVQAF